MSDWATAADDWARSKTGEPGAMPPATLADIVDSNWRAAGLQTLGGLGAPVAAAYGELEHQLRAETGMDAATFTGEWGGRGSPPVAYEDRARLIAENLGSLDKGARETLAPLADVSARAAEKAQAADDQAAAIAARTYGIGGNALGFVAGMTRQLVDPLNLATAIVGGPETGGVLASLAREFAVGAGVTAVLDPAIQAQRRELGLATGNYVTDVLVGGAMTAGLGGLFRGGAAVARKLTGLGVRPPIASEDLDAVAHLAERNAVVAEQAVPPTPVARARLPERIDRASAAIENGGRVAPEPGLFGELAGDPSPQPSPARGEGAGGVSHVPLGPDEIVRPNGERLTVTPRVVELRDLVVSHGPDGSVNPNYPAALQARDRSAPASRSFVAEKAAQLEPVRLGRAPTAQEGAPIVGPDGVVESGNGRAMMIARAYDRHPERAAAYRSFLEAQGFKTDGMEFPVLVRVRQGELADRAAFARESNVATTAGLSPRERAFSDATSLDENLLALHQPGDTAALANIRFVRAFADRVVAAEERPAFVGADNRLSVEGARRMEAALVARGYGDTEIVARLYEEGATSSRAILGAFADTAPLAARVKAEISAGRLDGKLDAVPALIAAYRIVERARATGQKVGDLVDQVDLETGTVPDAVRAAAALFFRDDGYRVAAGRPVVGARIERTMLTALERTKAAGDLFGFEPDAAMTLREGWTAETPPEDITLAPEPGVAAAPGVLVRADLTAAAFEAHWSGLKEAQPFETVEGLMAIAPSRQAELVAALRATAGDLDGAEVKDPGTKKPERIAEKIAQKGYDSVREVTDAIRAGVTVTRPADGDAVVEALAQRFRVIDEGWFATQLGYIDRKVAIIFPDGTLAEVQLWPREILAAKGEGHRLYEEWRRAADPDEKAALKEKQRAYWAPVVASLPEDWRSLLNGGGPKASSSPAKSALPSSGETGYRPSTITSAPLTGSQPRLGERTKASSDGSDTTVSRPSQLNQERVSGAIAPDVSTGESAVKAGDPQLAADAQRIVDQVGEDFSIQLAEPGAEDGRAITIREARAEVAEDVAAADELLACMGLITLPTEGVPA